MIKMCWPPDHLWCEHHWQCIRNNCGSLRRWPQIIRTTRNSTRAFRLVYRLMASPKSINRSPSYRQTLHEIGKIKWIETKQPSACVSVNFNLKLRFFYGILSKRTRHLLCERNACEEFTVLHLGFLDYAHYIITVRFYDLEGFHQRYNIKNLIFFVSFATLSALLDILVF